MPSGAAASSESLRPKVGIAAIIVNGSGEILVGERKGSHGAGTIALPGGHLEPNESFATCAEREVLEETGLGTTGLSQVALTNDIFVNEGKHYITIFVVCRMNDPKAEPQVLEVNKCNWWRWKKWNWLQGVLEGKGEGEKGEVKLFLPMVNLLREYPNIGEMVGEAVKQPNVKR
ncbi:Polyketide cyclase/dehydrase and lipid transporter [Zalerion maritima]|uniref:Polyketide cyclase/dehydrase and lipid transporter n=1 Tax=Zalerion maritima TaxID=339359 RepID=A0AAD5RNI1_9PEZI|nr:Polyketide cyclase/dehydrase and lipid transporter [Zalerion maritima]